CSRNARWTGWCTPRWGACMCRALWAGRSRGSARSREECSALGPLGHRDVLEPFPVLLFGEHQLAGLVHVIVRLEASVRAPRVLQHDTAVLPHFGDHVDMGAHGVPGHGAISVAPGLPVEQPALTVAGPGIRNDHVPGGEFVPELVDRRLDVVCPRVLTGEGEHRICRLPALLDLPVPAAV